MATGARAETLVEAGVQLDALLGSSRAPRGFSAGDLDPAPRHLIRTAGAGGASGRFPGRERPLGGHAGTWSDQRRLWLCDSFAAGLTYGLGTGLQREQRPSSALAAARLLHRSRPL